MSFKPKQSGGGGTFEPFNLVVPKKDGNRYARLSLLVDMGIQEREDFVDEQSGEVKPQKACQQVAVFADLVKDVVDYGGTIGMKQYRMLLNKSFKGEVAGVNFYAVPPTDAKGNRIQNKPWGLHPANLLTKIAKAVDMEEVIIDDRNNPASLDIELLLDEPFLCNIEIKSTEAKDKKDADGNPIVYKNVNFKGAAPVPTDDDDQPVAVPELETPARSIQFDTATKEDIVFIRSGLLKQIKKALNYPGSQMEAAVQEFEAERAAAAEQEQNGKSDEDDDTPAPAAKPAASKSADKAAAKAAAKAGAAEPAKAAEKPKAATKAAAKTAAKPVKAAVPADDGDSDVPF